MEEPPVLPPPAILEPISRPSSASTTASQKDSLPGISAIAAAAAAAAAAVTSSPQLGFRYVQISCALELGLVDRKRRSRRAETQSVGRKRENRFI